jgi:hypothetical protein
MGIKIQPDLGSWFSDSLINHLLGMILRDWGVSFLASFFHAGSFPMSILIIACHRHQSTSQHVAQASNSVCTFFLAA